MKVDWELTPRMMFNQLSTRERDEIKAAIGFLADNFAGQPIGPDMTRLKIIPDEDRELFVMKVAQDFRLIFARSGDTIVIVDVFPISQIEGLKSARHSH